MKETSLIIAQQPWVNALHFYQVKLRPGGDTPRFLHQLTLTRLALFAADALRQLQRQDKAPKPLLIAAPDVEKNKTLVVAVLGSARYWRGPGGLQVTGCHCQHHHLLPPPPPPPPPPHLLHHPLYRTRSARRSSPRPPTRR